MFKFFDFISNAIANIFDFLTSLITGLLFVIQFIMEAVNFLLNFLSYVPEPFVIAICVLLPVSVIYLLFDKG